MFENTDFYSVVPRDTVYATVKLAVDACCHLNKQSSISLEVSQDIEAHVPALTHRKMNEESVFEWSINKVLFASTFDVFLDEFTEKH